MLESTEVSILKVLAYYDVFQHPLTSCEIVEFSRVPNVDIHKINAALEQLVERGVIFEYKDFFSIQEDHSLIERRLQSNRKAEVMKNTAQKKARLIGRFPFVKAVMISGSLSKGVLHEDGDIDFFIVTHSNRLWVARTFLILYKKIFLLNSRKYFCVNYFVDEDQLEIAEKNLFTATEIVTILPMVNSEVYTRFLEANGWTYDYYPQMSPRDVTSIVTSTKRWLGKFVENALQGSLGEWLDSTFMKITLKRWQRKFGHYSEEEFELAMKTNKRVSKHHPSNFQKRVLEKYTENFNRFEHLI